MVLVRETDCGFQRADGRTGGRAGDGDRGLGSTEGERSESLGRWAICCSHDVHVPWVVGESLTSRYLLFSDRYMPATGDQRASATTSYVLVYFGAEKYYLVSRPFTQVPPLLESRKMSHKDLTDCTRYMGPKPSQAKPWCRFRRGLLNIPRRQ